jgi:hypothetical protein
MCRSTAAIACIGIVRHCSFFAGDWTVLRNHSVYCRCLTLYLLYALRTMYALVQRITSLLCQPEFKGRALHLVHCVMHCPDVFYTPGHVYSVCFAQSSLLCTATRLCISLQALTYLMCSQQVPSYCHMTLGLPLLADVLSATGAAQQNPGSAGGRLLFVSQPWPCFEVYSALLSSTEVVAACIRCVLVHVLPSPTSQDALAILMRAASVILYVHCLQITSGLICATSRMPFVRWLFCI